MRTRSVLSLAAVAGASVVIGAIVAAGAAAPNTAATAAGEPSRSSTSSSTGAHAGSHPAPVASSAAPDARRATPAASSYPPPKPGRYTYGSPGGDTVTQVSVTAAGRGVWRLDESVIVRSALVQRRQEAWSTDGVHVLAVWEAGQPQPCVWSNPPADVAFPASNTPTWSVDASCRVVNGTTSQSVTHVRGTFRTANARLTVAGHTVQAWLVTGTEVTTVDGNVRGHKYHTVDRTTTRVWFLPSVGLPGRTELTGTVAITSEKGTTRHHIGQVTQLKSLTPQ